MNGCIPGYFTHSNSQRFYESILKLDFHGLDYWSQIFANVASWAMSRPSTMWTELVKNYTKTVFRGDDLCSGEDIDLVTQFRTWRDVRPADMNFRDAGGDCHTKCLVARAKAYGKTFNKTHLCIFVTSDNATSSAVLVKTLKGLSTESLQFRAFTHEDEDVHWHTIDLTSGNTRYEMPPNKAEVLSAHSELFDWYLMGEAKAAVYTGGSTYGMTARLRKGIENHLLDYTAFVEDNKCKCQPFYPTYGVSENLERRRRLFEGFADRP